MLPWATENAVAGPMWPAGHYLPTLAPDLTDIDFSIIPRPMIILESETLEIYAKLNLLQVCIIINEWTGCM